MSEMIERCCEAYWNAGWSVRHGRPEWASQEEDQKEVVRHRMRAAIEAMREPTDGQIMSALAWSLEWMRQHNVDALTPFKDYPPVKETTAGMWKAAIDAALT